MWRSSNIYTFSQLINALENEKTCESANYVSLGKVPDVPKEEYLSKSKYEYPCPVELAGEAAFKDKFSIKFSKELMKEVIPSSSSTEPTSSKSTPRFVSSI